jgi:hypothetical protein
MKEEESGGRRMGKKNLKRERTRKRKGRAEPVAKASPQEHKGLERRHMLAEAQGEGGWISW